VPSTSIGHSLSAQVRIIYACAGRLLQAKTRESPIGIFSVLIEPVATIGVMTLVFSYVRFRVPTLGDYLMIFLMTGILPISVFRQSIAGAETGFLRLRHLLVMPQIQPTDLMVAGVMNTLIILWSLFIAFTLFFHYFYAMEWPENMIFCFIPAFCNAMFGFGVGMINMVIKTWWRYWGTIFGILIGPIGILSGMFYTIDRMPQKVQDILFYNPLMHSTELVRTFYFYEYNSSFFSPLYYYGTTFGTLGVGLMCERMFRYRLLHQKK